MDVDRYITDEAVDAARDALWPAAWPEAENALRAALPHIIPAVRTLAAEYNNTLAAMYVWRQRTNTAEAAIQRVRDLHTRDEWGTCAGCSGSEGENWPCPTIRALDGDDA